jgi:phosphatidylethanolamine/phosphatidyl-N-methylethanolamine N-methyltransferase
MGRALPNSAFLVDQARFLRRLIRQPRGVGAIAPSSAALARAMAAQIPAGDGAILELGPGTGIVTEAILARGIAPERLTTIEYDAEFAALVARRFPHIRVVRGDAFDLAKTLGATAPFAAIVSSLPLLNFPSEQRAQLMTQIFARLAPGAPFIQFSYGLRPPVPPPSGANVTRAARILFNLPPARVWVYRKDR